MVRSWQAAAVAAAATPRRSEVRRFPDRAGFSAKALGEFNGDCGIWNENAGDGCDPSCDHCFTASSNSGLEPCLKGNDHLSKLDRAVFCGRHNEAAFRVCCGKSAEPLSCNVRPRDTLAGQTDSQPIASASVFSCCEHSARTSKPASLVVDTWEIYGWPALLGGCNALAELAPRVLQDLIPLRAATSDLLGSSQDWGRAVVWRKQP